MAALTALTALCALASCFQINPVESCRLLCTASDGCPGDLFCQIPAGQSQGLCASPNTRMCGLTDASIDGLDAGGTDAHPDAEAGVSLPPQMLCHNGHCFTLSDTLRANLVLLLWPSNLPPVVGSPVSIWADQSGKGNDAISLTPSAPPSVIPDGVHLDPTKLGSGFAVPNSPTLDFGSGDFAVLVIAGIASNTSPVTLFSKSDGARANSRRISIEWALSSANSGRPEVTVDDTSLSATVDTVQPSIAAYGLYRATDHLELHLNGSVLTTGDLPTPNLSTSNAEDVYIGVVNLNGVPADSIEAVIAIRGTVGASELNELELFLNGAFSTGPR